MAGKYNLEKLSLFDLHMKKVDAGLTWLASQLERLMADSVTVLSPF